MSGVFYGVGVGPGDPELLTVKAIKAIEAADVIIAPKTEKKEGSVALTIASPYLKPDVEILTQVFPMVSDTEILTEAWASNKQTILTLLAAGKKVVFLTLGDPMFYSTYIYVFRLLGDSGYPIETIPGITAFCAIGSKLGYPLVEGNNILSIIPATIEQDKLDKALALSDNVVLMKVYKNYQDVVAKLKRHQLADNAVMISRCGLPGEEVVHELHTAGDKKINYLSTILARRI
ncbi:precorrin-2 C(20)-methyltransferase|uniref:Precorrin-2/cobalt-factor-2 C20-methyltransferase n=1 Tax=Dendrosporobacter quercicolus TaxID=146817 RepID=A0A1G9R0F4_9FIRM|nr:precorrin-2 C(20)-methyltransferase [Dendrosporobacter quercicolus]NSL48411.1 precorrin-2 C(20)-methyltransferase [Dendrosporobacter quercicolus DSM 1736]SDM15945.1 precorrin-2/cobalt-factor-2 C20-methyltransferase [Dendrosporobacter quercicolus]